MRDVPVASALSYEVLKFRREHPELESSRLDSSNQRLRAITAVASVFDGFAADREGVMDSYQGESMRWPEGKR